MKLVPKKTATLSSCACAYRKVLRILFCQITLQGRASLTRRAIQQSIPMQFRLCWFCRAYVEDQDVQNWAALLILRLISICFRGHCIWYHNAYAIYIFDMLPVCDTMSPYIPLLSISRTVMHIGAFIITAGMPYDAC